ncbi:MAG: exodeoxyribonuclease VII large subunit [Candidatus Poseidoniia archaeon]|nr:exodeoxyribonuclease VII large subunit [Candidatus Poseidoniia archaeon]
MFAPVWTLQQLSQRVKQAVEGVAEFRDIRVEGEVIKPYKAASGHLYFTLSDGQSSLSCVAWANSQGSFATQPEEGQQVIARGSLSTYGARSQYQLTVRGLRPSGAGDRAAAIEALKRKLRSEGLFDDQYKKELPRFPLHVALVTGAGSAALNDVLKVARQRWPLARVSVIPALVQGTGAPAALVAALERADALGAELLILARGGGSPEDLDGFNAEPVVRAVFGCATPVVSGVGHEIDTTVVDFVADLRAATPSNAAELALPDWREVDARFAGALQQLAALAGRRVERETAALDALRHRLVLAHPRKRLREGVQRLDSATAQLQRGLRTLLGAQTERLAKAGAMLAGLDPTAVLGRGYAIVQQGGSVLRTPVPVGSEIDITLGKGGMECQVTKTRS